LGLPADRNPWPKAQLEQLVVDSEWKLCQIPYQVLVDKSYPTEA
jgi:hypothetical protein